MKLLCSRQALQEALGLVGSVVSARSPKEVLKSVRLSCDQNGLFLEGTDLEVAARAVVSQVEVNEPGEALLPADRFGQLTNAVARTTPWPSSRPRSVRHPRPG